MSMAMHFTTLLSCYAMYRFAEGLTVLTYDTFGEASIVSLKSLKVATFQPLCN